MRKLACVLFVLLIGHAAATAAEFSFEGIVLGKPIKAQYPDAKVTTKDDGSGAAVVEVPAGKRMGFDKYLLTILDGNVQCIYGVSTPRSAAEYTLPALTKKYGRPDVKTYPMRNPKGAQFDAYRYEWKLPGEVWVELDVSTKSIDKAHLAVTTKKCRTRKP
ncbi:MAG TPA: hypothetical protein PLR20_01635 [Syntrophales bacterium]|nr:hypothetical protein [Syntrophales bacterium]HOX95384.1 hypothetical protein [Syntrophales bacterium]HPI57176.1 hypothetical protein [Syntrophales bacterium]HPN23440.1 hypothetical protein [Syntrophales bacterium]HQM28035.1 hypothetical protein [Syntrophales bacterium]